MLVSRYSTLFLGGAAVLGACFGSVGDAQAGKKYTSYVNVWSPSSTTKAATGAIGAARNSADDIQYIGCWFRGFDPGTVSGGCYAYDSDRNYAGCTTSDWDLLEVIKHMWDSSYIRFYAKADGTCEDITTYNDSYEQPKLP